MRGVTHAATGALGGVGLAHWILGYAPDSPQLAVVGLVAAGAGYALDLDHPQATVAHTFGWASEQLSEFVADVSGGHRHKTHTQPGCWAFGGVAWLLAVYGGAGAAWLVARVIGWTIWLLATYGGVVGAWLTPLVAGASGALVDVAGQLGQYLAVILCLGLGVGALGMTKKGMGSTVAVFGGCAAFVIATASAGVTYEWVWKAVVVGCYAHLLGDLCTKQGVMLFWPLTSYRFKIAWLTTGKLVECAVVFPALIIGIVLAGLYQLGQWPLVEAAANAVVAAR